MARKKHRTVPAAEVYEKSSSDGYPQLPLPTAPPLSPGRMDGVYPGHFAPPLHQAFHVQQASTQHVPDQIARFNVIKPDRLAKRHNPQLYTKRLKIWFIQGWEICSNHEQSWILYFQRLHGRLLLFLVLCFSLRMGRRRSIRNHVGRSATTHLPNRLGVSKMWSRWRLPQHEVPILKNPVEKAIIFSKKPYLFYFDLTKCISYTTALGGCQTTQICVEECPSTYFSYLQLRTSSAAEIQKHVNSKYQLSLYLCCCCRWKVWYTVPRTSTRMLSQRSKLSRHWFNKGNVYHTQWSLFQVRICKEQDFEQLTSSSAATLFPGSHIQRRRQS